jgi:RecA/RadA recombinase
MTIKIEGTYPPLKYVVTGLHSFDRAVGNPFAVGEPVGLPLRTIVEIHGRPKAGKSTLAYFLAASINKTGTIVPVDFDGFSLDYLRSVMEGVGFDGTLRLVSEYVKEEPRPYADMLMEMARALREPEVSAGIFDSVSTYQSTHESESEIGESSMGRRAQEVGQFCRKTLNALRDPSVEPKAVFVINHDYSKIGGHGTTTAGGQVLEASKQVSISIYRQEKLIADKEYERDDYIISGKTTKLRYGGEGRKFLLACILGRGIHIGMTAVLDCVQYKLATREGTVKLKGKSVGRLRALVEAAASGKDEKFQPFIAALTEFKPNQPEEVEDAKDE